MGFGTWYLRFDVWCFNQLAASWYVVPGVLYLVGCVWYVVSVRVIVGTQHAPPQSHGKHIRGELSQLTTDWRSASFSKFGLWGSPVDLSWAHVNWTVPFQGPADFEFHPLDWPWLNMAVDGFNFHPLDFHCFHWISTVSVWIYFPSTGFPLFPPC